MSKFEDIVYVLKKDIEPEELRYSLRSVDKYFPHRSVWFVGGCPEGLKPDHMLEHEQSGGTKWERVKSSLIEICKQPELSEDFYLFNDDFYILKPQTGEFINMTDGTIERRITEIVTRSGSSGYTRQLKDLKTHLSYRGYDTISFAVHMPFLVNKTNLLTLLRSRDQHQMFRGLYGNVYKVPYIYHKDCKIYDKENIPGQDWDYLSTTEVSFQFGKVGEWIRETFREPSRFEV